MSMFARCGVDLLLAGHMHAGTSESTAVGGGEGGGYSAIAVQAGTATSTRLRNEPNAFNVIRLDLNRIDVQQFVRNAGSAAFSATQARTFERSAGGWSATG
jgi:hypothetical protein